jgi:predicted ATPase
MLQQLYIDNYKSCVNFLFEPKSLTLLLGDNGSGKTSVFEVLEKLGDIVNQGVSTTDAFPTSTLTIWDQRSVQTFELGLEAPGGNYRYRIEIEHERISSKSRLKHESLMLDEVLLYEFDGNDAHLFHDDGSVGAVFPFDGSRSAISTIPERRDNQGLTKFHKHMGWIFVLSPDPLRMSATSDDEVVFPNRRMSNIGSWLRHVALENGNAMRQLERFLADDVLPGFVQIKQEKLSERSRVMKFEFQALGQPAGEGNATNRYLLTFEQLSDGQRNLVALYAIACALIHDVATVCLDEPDNYVALREIQPWLIVVKDKVADAHGQCLIISHHPELLNYLAAHHGTVVYRDGFGPTRVKPFEW